MVESAFEYAFKNTEDQSILFLLKVKVGLKLFKLNLMCFSVLVILYLPSNNPINLNKRILLNFTKWTEEYKRKND